MNRDTRELIEAIIPLASRATLCAYPLGEAPVREVVETYRTVVIAFLDGLEGRET